MSARKGETASGCSRAHSSRIRRTHPRPQETPLDTVSTLIATPAGCSWSSTTWNCDRQRHRPSSHLAGSSAMPRPVRLLAAACTPPTSTTMPWRTARRVRQPTCSALCLGERGGRPLRRRRPEFSVHARPSRRQNQPAAQARAEDKPPRPSPAHRPHRLARSRRQRHWMGRGGGTGDHLPRTGGCSGCRHATPNPALPQPPAATSRHIRQVQSRKVTPMFFLFQDGSSSPPRTRRCASAVLGAAAAIVMAAGLAGCASSGQAGAPPARGSPIAPHPSSAAGSAVPTVSAVQQPADGQAGPMVAVEGTVQWVVPGLPNCADLRTNRRPPQILSLVGTTADQLRHAAEAGHGQSSEQATITGYVPPAAATVCSGLTFSVTQVSR